MATAELVVYQGTNSTEPPATVVCDTAATANTVVKRGTDGKIDAGSIPAIALSTIQVVANQAARLALTAEVGDIAKQTDTGKTFMLGSSPASTNGNWIEITASAPTAATVPFTPAGGLASTDVQAAITELDTEKAPSSHTHVSADITDLTTGGASAGQRAYLVHNGVYSYFSTLAAAQTAAVDGDKVNGHGLFNERITITKNISLHFETPNDGMAYTGNGGHLITDGGTARTFDITGHGTFTHTGTTTLQNIIELSAAGSRVTFSASYACSSYGSFVQMDAAARLKVNLLKLELLSTSFKGIELLTGASFVDAHIWETVSAATQECYYINAVGSTLILNLDTYVGTGGSYAVQCDMAGTGFVRVRKMTAGNGNGAIHQEAGELTVQGDFISAYPRVFDGTVGGTLTILPGRYVNSNGEYGDVIGTVSTQTVKIHAGAVLIAGTTSGYSINGGAGSVVYLYGDIYANQPIHSNVTTKSGLGVLINSTDVI